MTNRLRSTSKTRIPFIGVLFLALIGLPIAPIGNLRAQTPRTAGHEHVRTAAGAMLVVTGPRFHVTMSPENDSSA